MVESIDVDVYRIPNVNSIITRIINKVLRFIIKIRMRRKLAEISSIITMPQVKKYYIDLRFPGLMGYGLSYVFTWRLVAKLVEKGFDVVKFHSRLDDPEDTYPREKIELAGHGKRVIILWQFKVNGHVVVEVEDTYQLQDPIE